MSGLVFPVLGSWHWGGGVKEHESRPLGNWQSDNAVDIMAPAGSLVVAPVQGRVVRISGHSPSEGPSGTIFGRSVTIQEPSGREWFVTHLDDPFVRVGQFIQAGSPISKVANWGSNSHAHWAVSQGDPRALLGGSPSVPANMYGSLGQTAPQSAGCATMLMVQLAYTMLALYGIVKVVM